MSDIKQKFVGDVSQLEKEIEKLRKKNVQLDESLQKLGKTSKLGGDQAIANMRNQLSASGLASQGQAKLIDSLKSTVLQYASVGIAIQEVIKHEQELQRVQELRGSGVKAAGLAEREFIRNLGPDFTREQVQRLVEQGKADAVATAIPHSTYFKALSATTTAAGGNSEMAMRIVKGMAPLQVAEPENLVETASSIPMLMKSIGVEDPKKVIAYQQSLMAQMALRKDADFPALAKAINMGQVAQQGRDQLTEASNTGGLLSAIGLAIGDTTGDKTSTIVGKIERTLESVVGGKMDDAARLQKIQGSAKLQEKFAQLYGNDESSLLVRSLVTDRNSEVSKQFFAAKDKFSTAEAGYDRMIDNLNYGSPETLATVIDAKLQGGNANAMLAAKEHLKTSLAAAVGTNLELTRSPEGRVLNWSQMRTEYGLARRAQMLNAPTAERAIELGEHFIKGRLHTREVETRDWKQGTYDPDIARSSREMLTTLNEIKSLLANAKATPEQLERIATKLDEGNRINTKAATAKPSAQNNIHGERE